MDTHIRFVVCILYDAVAGTEYVSYFRTLTSPGVEVLWNQMGSTLRFYRTDILPVAGAHVVLEKSYKR